MLLLAKVMSNSELLESNLLLNSKSMMNMRYRKLTRIKYNQVTLIRMLIQRKYQNNRMRGILTPLSKFPKHQQVTHSLRRRRVWLLKRNLKQSTRMHK
jgi:hypothetical protein